MAKETVKIRLPLSRDEKGDYWGALNGKPYVIKRGVYVDVPKAIARQIEEREQRIAEAYTRAEALKQK